MKKIVIMLLTALFICQLCACQADPAGGPNVRMAEQIAEKIHNDTYQQKLPLSQIVTPELVTVYIEKYSVNELIRKLGDMSRYDKDPTDRNEALKKAMEFYGKADKVSFYWDEVKELTNDSGYYAGRKDEHEKETVSGKFNAGSDNHITYGTTYKYRDVYYRGDWAVVYSHGEDYSEGRYGWIGGKFYDEPAHFYAISDVSVEYKGRSVAFYDGDLTDMKEISFEVFTESGKEWIFHYDEDFGKYFLDYVIPLRD